MPKNFKLTSETFLFCEFFILLPSFLFFASLFLALFHNFTLLNALSLTLLKTLFIAVFCPAAAGLLAYQYLERYGPKGIVRNITKYILGYSIVEMGLVMGYLLLAIAAVRM